MRNFFIVLVLAMLAPGCGSPEKKDKEQLQPEAWVGIPDLPSAVPINPGAREVLEEWPQFLSLEERIAALSQTRSREELQLLLEELSQICNQVEENAIPLTFERPSVRSRLRVVRTYIGKSDAALLYREDHGEALMELMQAYNALREQFNLIINSTLKPELFETE
ncbi:hypothetical protein [Robiginitalea marina]|uniref:Uncharacterized protein n=1 Tax=Robiginitalea marina TaxID=2954105 RepID=A0ABT1AYK4_9FLAO|nr:hypothetical protein [Robiginitalea marina]MCO5725119.1 hypothetical protein [Robiginitalea marina]